MPVYITYAIQLLLIIHVLKTGRDRYWVFLLIFLPMVGGAAYLIMEVLPEFFASLSGQRARRGMKSIIDPGADVRSQAEAWEQSPNAENGRRYAQALIAAKKPQEALEVLSQSLSGFFENDPTLLLLKAQASFDLGEWDETLAALDTLKESNPEHRSPQGHLLYARAMEQAERLDESIEEYKAVASYYPGAEARYRLASAYKAKGDVDSAREEYEGILRDAKVAPAHFRKSQRSWLKASEEALKTL